MSENEYTLWIDVNIKDRHGNNLEHDEDVKPTNLGTAKGAEYLAAFKFTTAKQCRLTVPVHQGGGRYGVPADAPRLSLCNVSPRQGGRISGRQPIQYVFNRYLQCSYIRMNSYHFSPPLHTARLNVSRRLPVKKGRSTTALVPGDFHCARKVVTFTPRDEWPANEAFGTSFQGNVFAATHKIDYNPRGYYYAHYTSLREVFYPAGMLMASHGFFYHNMGDPPGDNPDTGDDKPKDVVDHGPEQKCEGRTISLDTTKGRWFETPVGEIPHHKRANKKVRVKGIHTYWANQKLVLRVRDNCKAGWYRLRVPAKNIKVPWLAAITMGALLAAFAAGILKRRFE